MDLRIVRTKNSIRSAFIELRAHKPLEKISIKELTTKADISKQTFYLHYKDIYDLADKLEDEAINSLISDIPNPEDITKNAPEAAKQIYYAFLSQGNMFDILFSLGEYSNTASEVDAHHSDFSTSRQYGILAAKIEEKIKDLVYESHPEFRDDLKENVIMSLIITGSANTFFKYQNQDTDQVIAILTNLIECIVKYHD